MSGNSCEMFLCNSAEDTDRVANVLRALADNRVDGTIIRGSGLPDGRLSPRLRGQHAAVLVNRPAPIELVAHVGIPQTYASEPSQGGGDG